MDKPGVMIVVGGSRGIGAAVAKQAAASGYHVVLTYSSRREMAQSVADELHAAGGRADYLCADVARESDIVSLFAKAAEYGPITAMVYSSGITGSASKLQDAELATLQQVMTVNLTGAMLCAREDREW